MGRDLGLSKVVEVPMSEISDVAALSLPPGFRFHPTDEELVSYYLKKKVLGRPLFDAIGEVDVYKHEPWDLSGYSKMKTRDQEWYFFSVLDKKYCEGRRMSRGTKRGYWKATGKDKEIIRGDNLIGMVKVFMYYIGRAPYGKRTKWVIYEYRLVEYEPEKKVDQSAYVLCKLFRKDDELVPPVCEKEWEKWDGKALIPGENVIAHAYDINEIHQQEKQLQSKNLELPREFEMDGYSEDNDDETPYASENLPLCIVNKEAPLPLTQYKRKRRNSNHSIRNSNNSKGITHHDHCSSTITTTSSAAVTNTDISAALLKLSLNKNQNQTEPVAALTSSPTKVIKDLQKENRQIIVEREKLKFEVMEADMLINFLQERNYALREENKDLRKKGK